MQSHPPPLPLCLMFLLLLFLLLFLFLFFCGFVLFQVEAVELVFPCFPAKSLYLERNNPVKRSFSITGTKAWNLIPSDWRDTSKFVFKRKIPGFLFHTCLDRDDYMLKSILYFKYNTQALQNVYVTYLIDLTVFSKPLRNVGYLIFVLFAKLLHLGFLTFSFLSSSPPATISLTPRVAWKISFLRFSSL